MNTTQHSLDLLDQDITSTERDMSHLENHMKINTMIQDLSQLPLRFNGPAYNRTADDARLTGQILRVWNCMKDGQWRTLDEISGITGDPQASVSAQLRHLRKARFGSHEVEKQSRGERQNGLWEYRVKKSGATFSDYPHHL